MRPQLGPPPTLFEGTLWSAEELTALAHGWQDAIVPLLAHARAPVALVMVNHPRAIALFFALSALPVSLVVLPADPKGWRCSPPLPTGTAVVLLPTLAHLVTVVERLGLRPILVPEPTAAAPGGERSPFLTAPHLVMFTSGSTGLPKPVTRSLPRVLAAARAHLEAFEVPPGGGIIASLPMDRSFGLSRCLLAATVLGSRLGLVTRFDPGKVLQLFASGDYQYWIGTAVMADLLSRYPVPEPHAAPPVCVLGGPASEATLQRFQGRFGVLLRGNYGSTEDSAVTADGGPDSAVGPHTVGRPLAGVDLRIGDDPLSPAPAGATGRIWIKSPWPMDGYGFPPHLVPRESRSGWLATKDLGRLGEAGHLTLLGRIDDCVSTGPGYLVNLAEVLSALLTHPGVRDAAVVPVVEPSGPVVAALVEGEEGLTPDGLRRHLSGLLPSWSLPRILTITPALPRLPDGRPDRQACIASAQELRR